MDENDLPSDFPLFPLPHVVLFPHAQLPLHIFEPRYRAMTADALEAEGVIGLVLLKDAERAAEPRAPSYALGCAGPILNARRLSDGRYTFVLRGTRRFRVLRETLTESGYRRARVELLDDPDFERLARGPREALLSLRPALEHAVLELAREWAGASLDALRSRFASLDPVVLVDALSSHLDCPAIEKQGLLEAPDSVARGELLLRLLDFRRAERPWLEGAKLTN